MHLRKAMRSNLKPVCLLAAGCVTTAGLVLALQPQAPSEQAKWVSAPAAAASPSPSPTATPQADTGRLAAAAVSARLKQTGAHAAVAALDLRTGTTFTVGGSERFTTASIVKVAVVATLLLQRQDTGATLNAEQRRLAKAAITRSDNDATTRLWKLIGAAAGLRKASRRLGMTETKPSSSGWGRTTTIAPDQLRLLQTLADEHGPLTAANRSYLFGLMAQVTGTQDWGITAGADTSAKTYVKNGWVTVSADRGRWTVNSIGRITSTDHDWLIVVLSDHHASFNAGVKTVEDLATRSMKALTGSES